MSIEKQIIEKFKEYETIIISRHIRPDGDAVGSSKGLAYSLKASFPEKKVYVINEDYAQYVSFLGEEDTQLPDKEYSKALCVCVDTGTIDRVSNSKLHLAHEIIKIDHHIDDKPFGDISLVEDFRSSCSEIVANLIRNNSEVLKMTKEAAYCLYTGIVTDSGRFKYVEANGDTLRTAGYLLDQGIDKEDIYNNLYLETLEEFKIENEFCRQVRFTENNAGYIVLKNETIKEMGISMETASTSVDVMQAIKGTDIWIAFIEQDNKDIRVRLRSRGIDVQKLASKYHGGGHINASGATCYSWEEVDNLLKDADSLHCIAKKQYKK